MMKSFFNIVLLFQFLFLMSCTSKSVTAHINGKQDTIYVDTQTHDYIGEECYDVVSVKSLTLPHGVEDFPDGAKVMVRNDKIYIWDNTQNRSSVYVFDENGSYQFLVGGQKGRARNELIGDIRCFDVDSNNWIHLYDRDGHKILVFDDKGKYSHTVMLRDLPSAMQVSSDGNSYYLSYERFSLKKEKTRLIQIDKDGDVVKKLFELDESSDLGDGEFISSSLSKNSQGDIMYVPSQIDYILTIKDDSIYRSNFIFDRGFISKEELLRLRKSGELRPKSDCVSKIRKFCQTDSLLFLEYMVPECNRSMLIDKAHQKTYNLEGCLYLQGLGSVSCFNNDNELVCLVRKEEIERKREDWEWCQEQNIKEAFLPVMEQMLRGQIKTPAIVFVKMK